jgi:hypothetical protein
MESSTTQTNYQQITVDVPEDRIAEFHAFFARFLAGRSGRGYRGRHHHRGHGRRCGERTERGEQAETTGQPTEITEV